MTVAPLRSSFLFSGDVSFNVTESDIEFTGSVDLDHAQFTCWVGKASINTLFLRKRFCLNSLVSEMTAVLGVAIGFSLRDELTHFFYFIQAFFSGEFRSPVRAVFPLGGFLALDVSCILL